MPAIRITGFIGEQPRILPTLIPANAGKAAVNLRLDDGGLTPTREAIQETSIASAAHKTIFRHGEEWLSWAGHVHAAKGPVAEDRLYYTGDGKPKMKVGATVYDLAIAKPAGALTATLGGAGAGDVVTRLYVYTWVTAFGEESEPCPVSNAINWQPGNTVTLSGFAAAPAGRNITKQRIYRTQTGQSGTYFYFIAERAASNANFNDTVAVDAFSEPLPSLDWNPPVDGLKGLTMLPNGIFAGFDGRDLYFSEPYIPHAWPQKYALHTDFEIVGIGAAGQSVVVTTKGQPYLVVGTHPQSMQMDKIEVNLPCINARGIADLGYAVCYPSHEGLVAVDANGAARVVTANLFNRDSWLALSPSTFVAGQISGRYLAFYDTVDADDNVVAGAIYVDIGQAPYLIRSDVRASATYFDIGTGELFFLATGTDDVFQFDSPFGAREYFYWRSKEFQMPVPTNYGVIKVDADAALSDQELANLQALIEQILADNAALIAGDDIAGEIEGAAIGEYDIEGDELEEVPTISSSLMIGVYADGKKVAQVTKFNRPVRLPGGFRAEKWEIDVTGDVRVNQIVLGRTMEDLQQVPPT